MTMHKTRIEITTPMKAPINTRSVSLPTRGLSSLKGSSESRGLVRPVPVALSVTFLFSGIVCFLVSARVDAPEVVAALFAVAVATEVLVVRFSEHSGHLPQGVHSHIISQFCSREPHHDWHLLIVVLILLVMLCIVVLSGLLCISVFFVLLRVVVVCVGVVVDSVEIVLHS